MPIDPHSDKSHICISQAFKWTKETQSAKSTRTSLIDDIARRDADITVLVQGLREMSQAMTVLERRCAKILLETGQSESGDTVQREAATLQMRLDLVHASTSWRITAPLRMIARLFRI